MIHVGNPRRYRRLPPVERLVSLVFAIFGKDGARELRLDYEPSQRLIRMWYVVEGVPYEMVPPPGELWPDLLQVFWRATRFEPTNRPPWWAWFRKHARFPDVPVFGMLPVRFGSTTVEFDILYFRGPTGEHIVAELNNPSDVASLAAGFLRQTLRPDGTSGLD